MSKTTSISTNININPSLNIKFISPDDLEKYKALGYCFMMQRVPNIEVLSQLTPQERAIIKLLLHGKTPQQIAGLLSIDDSNVRKSLQHIREKMDCDNNIELVIKMLDDGLDSVLSQIG